MVRLADYPLSPGSMTSSTIASYAPCGVSFAAHGRSYRCILTGGVVAALTIALGTTIPLLGRLTAPEGARFE